MLAAAICCVQGYNNGEAISREFFDEHISGGHNILLSKFLWPDRDQEFRDKFSDEKEAMFRAYAGASLLHASVYIMYLCAALLDWRIVLPDIESL